MTVEALNNGKHVYNEKPLGVDRAEGLMVCNLAKEKGLRMPLDLTVLIISKVCSALEYAHRKKDENGQPLRIVHRDISPQNILISFEGEVKLTDFGIARTTEGADPSALDDDALEALALEVGALVVDREGLQLEIHLHPGLLLELRHHLLEDGGEGVLEHGAVDGDARERLGPPGGCPDPAPVPGGQQSGPRSHPQEFPSAETTTSDTRLPLRHDAPPAAARRLPVVSAPDSPSV